MVEILKSLSQLYDKLNSLFELDDNSYLESQDFINQLSEEGVCEYLAGFLRNKSIPKEKLESIFNLVFQLSNYTNIVCNLAHILLLSKQFDYLYLLVSKIFVAHIGTIAYHSNSSTVFAERNFDRFIEIVKTAKIKSDAYIPFLIEIYKSDKVGTYGYWKTPALEYLQNFWNKNEQWFVNFIERTPSLRYKTLGALIDFNTLKAIEFLIKDYHNNANFDLEQNISLMKTYKKDVLLYMDMNFLKATPEMQEKYVDILLNMDADNEVYVRLKDIFSSTQNPKIREVISNKMGLTATLNIRTEKQFLNAVRKKITEPQERTLGIPFDKFNLKFISGYPADNAVYTFIIYLFKEEKNLLNLYKLKNLSKIFEEDGLIDMLGKLFNNISAREDILQSKWVLRLIALLSESEMNKNIMYFLMDLYRKKRYKEARYLTFCLIYSKKVCIIKVFKKLLEENNEYLSEHINEFLDCICSYLCMNREDVLDMLVTKYYSDAEYDKQKNRLYDAFIAGKTYTLDTFNTLFIENPIFNKLAQGLIFGEYRFGRLYNAFVLEIKEPKFLIGKTIFEDEPEKNKDITIGMIHPLDCDFKFEKIFNHFPNPTFKQFEPTKFNNLDYSNSITTISRFAGVVVNRKAFLDRLFSYGFTPNRADDEKDIKSLIHLMPSLNIFCEVEFEPKITDTTNFATLSNICFYNISETLVAQNKYITKKTNALAISATPYRYFNYVLTLIYDASKL